jgi:DNA-directed RNA polymerase III subunit RPC2
MRRCVLKGKSEEELARLGECPLDPGGYFVVRVRIASALLF